MCEYSQTLEEPASEQEFAVEQGQRAAVGTGRVLLEQVRVLACKAVNKGERVAEQGHDASSRVEGDQGGTIVEEESEDRSEGAFTHMQQEAPFCIGACRGAWRRVLGGRLGQRVPPENQKLWQVQTHKVGTERHECAHECPSNGDFDGRDTEIVVAAVFEKLDGEREHLGANRE